MITRLTLVAIACVIAACAANPERQTPNSAPPSLIAPADNVEPFFMRQNVTITARGRAQQLDAVVQYDGTIVTIVFLNGVGRPFVQMVQRGDEVEISGPGASKVPFDLRWVMQEIGLALLLTPLQDTSKNGSYELESAAGPVTDEWVDGLLRRRAVVQSPTTMEYGWASTTRCPSTLSIANRARGYEIEIATTQCEESTP